MVWHSLHLTDLTVSHRLTYYVAERGHWNKLTYPAEKAAPAIFNTRLLRPLLVSDQKAGAKKMKAYNT